MWRNLADGGLSASIANIGLVLRRALPAALAVLASLCALVGAAGLAHLILLAAVPAAAVAVLDAVSDRIVQRAGLFDLALAVAGLVLVVAGAALRAPLIALGALGTFIPALAVADGASEPRSGWATAAATRPH
jgi:hypothetical protein